MEINLNGCHEISLKENVGNYHEVTKDVYFLYM